MLEPEQAQQETEVADAGGDEGLLGGGGGRRLVEPKTDQQVGGEADEFPADEEKEEAVGHQQSQHGGGEEAEEAEEPGEVRILMHVAGAEDEDQRADEGDHHAHERREWIEQPAEAQRVRSEVKPGEVVVGVRGGSGKGAFQRETGHDEGGGHGGDGGTGGDDTTAAGRERADGGGRERQRGDEPEIGGGQGHGSAFQARRILQQDVFLVAVDGDNEGQADGSLGGGDGDGEKHEDYPGGGRGRGAVAPERDEVDVGGIQHQLDAEQHEDGVGPRQRAGEADAKQRRGEKEAELERTHDSSS